MNIKAIGAAVVGAAAIGLSVGSIDPTPAEAATLTQNFSSASPSGLNLFQQFDASLGTLQSVVLDYSSSRTQNYTCLGSCTSSVRIDLNLAFPETSGLTFSSTVGPATFSAGPVSQTATTTGTYSFASLSQFIGTGKIGTYDNVPSPTSVSGNFDSTSTSLSNNFLLTYTYDATPVPTPALLPGLIGIGVAALRKRKAEKVEAEV